MTILMSSHLLSEIEQIVDRVVSLWMELCAGKQRWQISANNILPIWRTILFRLFKEVLTMRNLIALELKRNRLRSYHIAVLIFRNNLMLGFQYLMAAIPIWTPPARMRNCFPSIPS